MQKKVETHIIHDEKELDTLPIILSTGDRVFLYGDLGVGKTTLIRSLLRRYLDDPTLVVRSPTYTYYQKYQGVSPVYHFDLYRLEDRSLFHSIGGDDIISNPTSIALIEWPEILADSVTPTKKISLEILDNGVRRITISS